MGAWIETLGLVLPFENDSSHPTWVRGLKLAMKEKIDVIDEVAPYVGAWIETQHIQKK